MAGTVDQAAHRVGHHPRRRAGLEHRQCFFEFCRRCDPLSHILFFEDYRHPIMNRLPVVLGEKNVAAWIHPQTELKVALAMLGPYPSEKMVAYPVNSVVNIWANGT